MSSAPPDGVLFQEWIDDPFWMLVACQLVNLTTWRQARPAFEWIRETAVEPLNLSLADPPDLEDVLRPLGLWRRRAVMLPRFAGAWLRGRPETAEDVIRMPGCGRYAADSWAIFVERRFDVEPDDVPGRFLLEGNYPNPFNPETTIRYALPERARVRLMVYDVLGRKVAVLVDDDQLPGSYTARFDAASLPSGAYVYRLEAGSFSETRKMVLLK